MNIENNRVKEVFNEQSKYCYEGTKVLQNKLGITDPTELEKAERSLTLLRLTHLQMYGSRIKFSFSVEYYLEIHRFIFQDLYNFAGLTRNENITKGNTPFCRPEFIYKYLDYLLKDMQLKLKNINSKEDLVEYLAYYYSEINMVHPFRDGNGRVLREFLREIVKYKDINYELDYSNITDLDKDNLMNGSIESSRTGDISLLKEFFKSTLKENVKKI